MSDRKTPDRNTSPPAASAPELAPSPEAWRECWCEDACRYLDMMLDRREEERRGDETRDDGTRIDGTRISGARPPRER